MKKHQLSTYNFHLPEELIAQKPITPRDHSRLLVYIKASDQIIHDYFYNLNNYLPNNSLLVFNNSKVLPARIRIGQKEILLLKQIDENSWSALVRPGRKFQTNDSIVMPEDVKATVLKINQDGSRTLKFTPAINLNYLEKYGELPLPPYIKTTYSQELANKYQTIYSQEYGSIAAPTAGLHFTPQLLANIDQSHQRTELTLHVGLGTFSPIRDEKINTQVLHRENYSVSSETANKLNNAKRNQQPIIAVGTTSTRSLEAQLQDHQQFTSGNFSTNIFIYPDYEFKAINGLITNFHLPQSSLFILLSAYIGIDNAQKVYKEAVNQKYRFYSFGDACLII